MYTVTVDEADRDTFESLPDEEGRYTLAPSSADTETSVTVTVTVTLADGVNAGQTYTQTVTIAIPAAETTL